MNPSYTGLGVLTLVVELLGLLHALHALMHVRTSRGAIAWIIALIAMPWVALPLYWILGRSRFQGYIDLHRAGQEGVADTLEEADRAARPYREQDVGRLAPLAEVSSRLGGFPFTRGHEVELLIDGDRAFRSMLKALYQAEHYVLVTFFIVHNDRIGNTFKEALIELANRGVQVFFMFDEIGSRKIGRRYLQALRESGVQVRAFDTTKGRGNRLQINFRNHRKIIVVDGCTCFAGGLNLGDEYLGQDPHLGPWRDTHLRFTGPAVVDMQQVFLLDWYWAAGALPALTGHPPPVAEPGRMLQIMPTGPTHELPACQLYFLQLVEAARERLWITSPYFVPDGTIVAALQRAALRGVEVRILLPDRPDHLLVYLSSFTFYEPMLDAGVKLFRYHGGFMHQKVILIDEDLVSIGTANLDNRSFYLNFEVTVNVADAAFAGEVAAMLEQDFARAGEVQREEFDRRPRWFKLVCRAARLLAPIQ